MDDSGDKRRDHIIDVARESFIAEGIVKTRMRSVAEAAGISRKSLYRFFESKEELFAAVVRREVESLTRALEEAVEGLDAPGEKLVAFAETRLAFMRRLTGLNKSMAGEVAQLRPVILKIFSEYRWQLQELVEGIIREGNHRGDFAVEHVELLSRGLLFTMRGIDAALVYEGEDMGLELSQRELIETVLKGIAAGGDGSEGEGSSRPR